MKDSSLNIKDLYQKNQQLIKENRELKFKVNLMEDILDNMYEAVHAVDAEGKVIIYSRAGEKHNNLTKEEALGEYEYNLWKQPLNFSIDREKIIRTGKPIKNIQMIGRSTTGREFHVIAGFYPYFEDGEYKAFYYTGRDISNLDYFIKENMELKKQLSEDNDEKSLKNGTRYTLDDIIGNSLAIQKSKEKARKIANYNANILIYGETGTGKELFAQGIHNEGFYSNEPFIAFNCSAIPETLIESLLFGTVKGAFTGAENMEGLFEQVGKGTLFLDEINSMSPAMQAKLLRVLQEKKIRRVGDTKDIDIQCAIISATNIEPKEAVKKKILRRDLYYRIATVVLKIPPLRERKEDISTLLNHFIKILNKKHGRNIRNIDKKVLNHLQEHSWPGNVRELLNVLESAVILSDPQRISLTLEAFPNYDFRPKEETYYRKIDMEKETHFVKDDDNGKDLRSLLDAYEKAIISKVIDESNENISKAARILGIDRKSLYRKIEKYKLRE